jgi:hypothetical protein
MGKHLTDHDIEYIVGLLDGWSNKLTWETLCDACVPVIGAKPARQTLASIVRIESAYAACKKRLKENNNEVRLPPSRQMVAERINRLERENERLKRENIELLQQFVVWQYNAHCKGLSNIDLNKPLPGIDRGQTD